LNRFATIKAFIAQDVGELNEDTGSSTASLALLIIWEWADGATGLVHWLTAARLANVLRCDWRTANKALQAIIKRGLLRVKEPKGKEVKTGINRRFPVYELRHVVREEGRSNEAPEV
jgi:hypothetical protein